MNFFKKLAALTAVVAMLAAASHCEAAECAVNTGGMGYSDAYRSTSLTPAIALGTIAVVAIVAVAVQNTHGGGHGHSHGHSH